jgi:hypothetical protein
MTDDLVNRLRQAAAECSSWDNGLNPPLTEWSDLMDEAANAIEELEDDLPFNEGPVSTGGALYSRGRRYE